MKLQNSIETSFLVSAIQYTPDFFFLSGAFEKDEEKSVYHIYGRFHQRFRFSVDDTGNRKKNPRAID